MPDEFKVSDYLAFLSAYELTGGAVVSGSFQAFDQTYLIDALKILGKKFVGVTQIPANYPEEKILSLDKLGIKAVRFNIKRGGSALLSELAYLSQKVYSLCGWHTEIYIDANDLTIIEKQLLQIPKCSIDHLGLTKSGIPQLQKLIEKGIYVKATGFGRIDFDPIPVIKEFLKINPNSVMFGSDLPSTRAKIPFSEKDIKLIQDHFNEHECKKIFYENALNFYNIDF